MAEPLPPPARQSSPASGQKTKPYWDRRLEALRTKGTMPRDFLHGDWSKVDAPAEVLENLRFVWMSNIMAEKPPMAAGFSPDLYEPVTEELARELKIKVATRDRTPAGVPKIGDAFLVCCPKAVHKQQDEVWGVNIPLAKRNEQRKRELEEKLASARVANDLSSGAVGEVVTGRRNLTEVIEEGLEERGQNG